MLMLPWFALLAQTPPQIVQSVTVELPIETRKTIDSLLNDKKWPELCDFLESLTPKQRGGVLETWLTALKKAGRHERLLQVCDAVVPQLDGPKGPRLSSARLFRAGALSALGQHAEAMAAHAENARLGLPPAFESACAEARILGDWTSLTQLAEALSATQPGLGLSLMGESLCKQLQFSQAEPILEKAILLPGATAMAWADLACCRVERQAYPEAIAAAGQALVKEPANMEALYNRGRAYFGLKQYREGSADLAAALATGQADPAMAENIRTNIALAERYLAYQKKKAQAAPKKTGRR